MSTVMTDQEVLEEVKALGSTQRDFLRNAAKNDLYVLCKGILSYQDVNPATHGAFCQFIQHQERKRRLGLMPRGHLKSTIGTIGDSIRVVLADPDDARVLIVGETATTAEKFLAEAKNHFEKNETLRSLFPELIPSRFSGPGVTWSADRATLNRRSVHREPSWQAIGVGGAIVGGHFTRIKCDDLIGFDAARSPAEMAKAIDWTDNIEALLVNQHNDVIDWIGTRWSRNDLYSHIMLGYGSEIAVFTREAIENGQVIFPELHTLQEYERIQRIRPAIWFAQYCNNPMSGQQGDLPAHAVRAYKFSMDGTEVIFTTDTGREGRWRIDQLDRVLCADPNSGAKLAPDTAAIAIVGVSPDDEAFVLATWSSRVSASEFVDQIFTLGKRWKVRAVGIEKAGQQNTQEYFEKKAEKEDFYVRVQPLKHGGKNKEDRIRGVLEPIIRSGRLYVLASQTILREQIASFPDNILIDELDALAYFPQMSRTPAKEEDIEENDKVLNMVLRSRSRRTGY